MRSDSQWGQFRTNSGMSDLDLHIKEIGKTLTPERGPETPGEAVERLLAYYLNLEPAEQPAFVAALITEAVSLKAMRFAARPRPASNGKGAAA